MSGRARIGAALGYVAATFLAFPQPMPGGGVLDLGIVLAWVAPFFLLLTVRDLPPRRAAWVGFATSLGAHTALIHWIYVVTVVYGNAPAWVCLLYTSDAADE